MSCGLCIANLWRPIERPAYKNPLTLLDSSSISMAEETISWNLPGADFGFDNLGKRPMEERIPAAAVDAPALGPTYAPHHRWVYLPDMTPQDPRHSKVSDSRTSKAMAMPCHAMLCYAMLCYAMLCYAMLRYAMLCYRRRPNFRIAPQTERRRSAAPKQSIIQNKNKICSTQAAKRLPFTPRHKTASFPSPLASSISSLQHTTLPGARLRQSYHDCGRAQVLFPC